MRVLIVDDEPLARDALTRMARAFPAVTDVQEAPNALRAAELLRAERFDVVLLDIHMPEVSGLEMLERLSKFGEKLPAIVFVTAYDQHALEAFDWQAVDYVLKPFTQDRLHAALNRANNRTIQERTALLTQILPKLESLHKATPRIAVRSKGRVIFIAPNELVSVKAEGNYVLLQQRSGSQLLREQISTLAETLRPFGLVRIHRSALVNAAYVESLKPLTTGEYLLRMRDGAEFHVTRTYKKNLSSLAGVWMGYEGAKL